MEHENSSKTINSESREWGQAVWTQHGIKTIDGAVMIDYKSCEQPVESADQQ